MSTTPTPFADDAPDGALRAIVRRNPDDPAEIEMVAALWGSNPRFSGGVNYRFVRADSQLFPSNRCLVAASEFHMGVGEKRYRATLEGGNFFYLAAIWEPPIGDHPLAYRIITVDANPDIAPYQSRHGAIIQRRQVMQWLDFTLPESELLVTPPPHSFVVERLGQQALPL
jgi:putative SOS response-associated peptidase YedK